MKQDKPKKIERVKSALYSVMTAATPKRVETAKWVFYSSVAVTTILLFGCEGGSDPPKIPRNQGD